MHIQEQGCKTEKKIDQTGRTKNIAPLQQMRVGKRRGQPTAYVRAPVTREPIILRPVLY